MRASHRLRVESIDFRVIRARKLGHLEFRSRGKWGKNQEDEYMIISHTKERSKRKAGFGHSRLARRPAAGLMKHLRCGTFASATKKMCLGSADVPGPPEQNNDIITISVTDQTVHKVTGEGKPVIHTQGGHAMAQDGCGPERWGAHRPPAPDRSGVYVLKPQVRRVLISVGCSTQFQLLLTRPQKSEKLQRDLHWMVEAEEKQNKGRRGNREFL